MIEEAKRHFSVTDRGNHPWILLFFLFWHILLMLFTELLIWCIAIDRL